jgi:Protein of unknown function VcgC/VcgE (DUF2780)
MRINPRVLSFFIAICIVTIGFAFAEEQKTLGSLDDNELVKSVSDKLSVKPEQAAGGIGSVFNFAKGKLSPDDFGKVAKVIPQMDSLLKAAPVIDSSSTAVGSAMAKLGSNAGGIASLATSFDKLGLSPDMVGKFVPEILNYTQLKGGDATKNILANVLK